MMTSHFFPGQIVEESESSDYSGRTTLLVTKLHINNNHRKDMERQNEEQRKREEIAKMEERIREKEKQERELLEKIRREMEK